MMTPERIIHSPNFRFTPSFFRFMSQDRFSMPQSPLQEGWGGLHQRTDFFRQRGDQRSFHTNIRLRSPLHEG
ncbi:hypothetical protein TNCV_4021771 [Trichonephila clavipes]|nr:hypothetical protein TNCV_4021771 [Trichonephila clavipes]